jgi:hypothetical protein
MPSDRHASSARRGHPQAISGAPPAIAGALCRVMYRPLRGTARRTSRQVDKPNITHLQAPLFQAHGPRQNKPQWIIRQVVGKPAERSLRSWSRCGARHRRLRAKVCRLIGRPKCDGGLPDAGLPRAKMRPGMAAWPLICNGRESGMGSRCAIKGSDLQPKGAFDCIAFSGVVGPQYSN